VGTVNGYQRVIIIFEGTLLIGSILLIIFSGYIFFFAALVAMGCMIWGVLKWRDKKPPPFRYTNEIGLLGKYKIDHDVEDAMKKLDEEFPGASKGEL
jgi:hypothetical protein